MGEQVKKIMARFISLRLQSRLKNYIALICVLTVLYLLYNKLKARQPTDYERLVMERQKYAQDHNIFIDPLDIFKTSTANIPNYDDDLKNNEEEEHEKMMEGDTEDEEGEDEREQQLADEERRKEVEFLKQQEQEQIQHEEEQKRQEEEQRRQEEEQRRQEEEQRRQEEEKRRQEEEQRHQEDERRKQEEEQRQKEEEQRRLEEERMRQEEEQGQQQEEQNDNDPGKDDYMKEDENANSDVVIYSHDYTFNFDRFEVGQARFKFLKNFKSPCWLEDNLEQQPYNKSRLVTGPKYMKKGCFVEGLMKSKATFVQLPGMDRKYRVRCLPYFMLLGMAKSGTSDFQSRILESKYIYKGFSKELYWWDQYRFNPNATLSDYSDLLDFGVTDMIKLEEQDSNGGPYWPGLVGEMTTITLPDMAYWREDPRNAGLKEPKYLTPHDIFPVMPNVKLIVLMRNPLTRLYSHYNMWAPLRGYYKSPQDFHMRIVNSMKWWNDCQKILPLRNCLYGSPPEMPEVEHTLSSWWPTNANHSGEFRHGLYYLHLKEWLSVFPRENFLFLRSEDYDIDKLKTMNEEVYPFLGVPHLEGKEADNVANNPNRFQVDYEPMLPETKQILYDFYQPYNDQLAVLLGEERWNWRDQGYSD